MPKQKQIPNFKTESEEQTFWDKHDSTEYIDWKEGQKVTFLNLKPSTQTIDLL